MFKTSVFVILGAVLLALVSAAEENKTLPRPFGIGVGPSYIGGRDTDKEGTQLSLKIYKQYINYKRLMRQSFEKDELYYERFTDTNTCIGGCTVESFCQAGLCICKHDEGWVQNWGRCFGNKSVSFAGNHEKYRKPRPPDLPTWCYCTQRNGGKEICDNQRNNPECRKKEFPDVFDHNGQMCDHGDHKHCLKKDINMFCGEKKRWDTEVGRERSLCECRHDMAWDQRNMECRIKLDVDCTWEKRDPKLLETNLAKLILGTLDEPDKEYSDKEISSTFCNILDSVADEYNKHIVGEFNFTFLGLGIGSLVLIALITCCTACCCCKCCNSVKEKIRRMDPRNAMREAGMTQEAQLATLGAVAAGEYMENRNDKQDEARISAMQGQSIGMPGGAPPGYGPAPGGFADPGVGYPQGQQGYAPVPTGYPPQQPGYGPGPGYPPQQPGYIPPADGGPGIMNMAPELALAGAGAFSGNAAMTGMGVVAAAEKMGDQEDKEDRLRAAAIRGVPPPPLGYAGSTQPYPPQ